MTGNSSFHFRILLAALIWLAGSAAVRADIQITPLSDGPDTVGALVSGTFEYNDDFSELSAIARRHGIWAVTFNSDGGSPVAAMRLGKLIRALGLSTFQLRGLDCVSACSLAFLGGVERMAQPGAIGVHQAYIEGDSTDKDTAVAGIQMLTGSILAYLQEMGVDGRLMQIWLSVEASDMRYLTQAEMVDLHVVTSLPDAEPTAKSTQPPRREQTGGDMLTSGPRDLTPPPADAAAKPDRSSPEIVVQPRALPAIPAAYSGRVRYLKGPVPLKMEPSSQSPTVLNLSHGQPLVIKSSQGRWYGVDVLGRRGYLHHSWVLVDQFAPRPLNEFFIQVKSFDNLSETEDYVRRFPISLKAYLATNGWIAVVLNGTFPEEMANQVLKSLLRRGVIPSDSFATLGNTYTVLVCCEDAQ